MGRGGGGRVSNVSEGDIMIYRNFIIISAVMISCRMQPQVHRDAGFQHDDLTWNDYASGLIGASGL